MVVNIKLQTGTCCGKLVQVRGEDLVLWSIPLRNPYSKKLELFAMTCCYRSSLPTLEIFGARIGRRATRYRPLVRPVTVNVVAQARASGSSLSVLAP